MSHTAIHARPTAPMNTKPERHPYASVSQATTGGAKAEPSDEPALKIPTTSARWLAGNHSAVALAAAGQFPGSRIPRRKRAPASDHLPRTNPCSIAASDQVKMNAANP